MCPVYCESALIIDQGAAVSLTAPTAMVTVAGPDEPEVVDEFDSAEVVAAVKVLTVRAANTASTCRANIAAASFNCMVFGWYTQQEQEQHGNKDGAHFPFNNQMPHRESQCWPLRGC
jgi:hypothetical protein